MSGNNSLFGTIGNQEENRTRKYNRILEGINRIFSNVVQAKTEEELGNACLSVALEVTGSQIGFAGEVGSDGLLRNIAISYTGWNQCTPYDKTGHHHPPGGFSLRGLYGCVIDSGKGLFINDPQSHPESIGLPSGYPALTSFLGVPLIQEGKAVGMLGVANRKGGYSCEQLEDLEAIAPAVTQVLKRKREEQERKQAEQMLARQAFMLANINDAVIGMDSDYRINYWSQSAEKMYGYRAEEIIGQYSGILKPEFFGMTNKEAIERLESTGTLRVELTHITKDGRKIIVDSSNQLLYDDKGKPIGMIGINRDITERKHAEEALKKAHETLEEKVKERTAELEEAYNLLLENEMRLSEAQKIAHLGSWDWDLLTDELYWSNEIYRILRLDPLEFFANYDAFLNYVHPDDRDYVENAVKEVLNGKLISTDFRIISADGGERIVYAQGEAIFDEKHNPVRMTGIFQDITERKKVEEALNEIEKIRIKEIHHRIKNNLQVISSLLDLQAEKFEDENVIEALRESQNRVFSMSLLHEELYKGEGNDTLDFSAYLKKLAENLFKTYSLSSKKIRLSIDLEENAFLDLDTAVPLGIIVNELISNSLKHAFTEKKEGEIRIQLCRDKKMSNEMQKSLFSLKISDDGKGIPEDLELENTESLGLQLVSILVDQLDGELELKKDNGTEFTVLFNVAEKKQLGIGSSTTIS